MIGHANLLPGHSDSYWSFSRWMSKVFRLEISAISAERDGITTYYLILFIKLHFRQHMSPCCCLINIRGSTDKMTKHFSKPGSYILMHSMHCRGWMAACWKHLYRWRRSKAAESVFSPSFSTSRQFCWSHTHVIGCLGKVSCISVRSCKNMILDQST